MPKDTREKVTLSLEAFKALQIEAMLHGGSMKDTASKLILKAACPKCIEILDVMARPPKGTLHQGMQARLKSSFIFSARSDEHTISTLRAQPLYPMSTL